MQKITLDYDNKLLIIHEKMKIKDFDDIVCKLKRSVNDIFDWEMIIKND